MLAVLQLPERRRPTWVAEITGRCEKFGLRRRFVAKRKDYRRSYARSAVVTLCFVLGPGVYEVGEKIGSRDIRRFVEVGNGVISDITLERVEQFLDQAEAPKGSAEMIDPKIILATQAAAADIASLTKETDPSGKQRRLLESVTDGPTAHTRMVAGKCRDAPILREFLEEMEKASRLLFGDP